MAPTDDHKDWQLVAGFQKQDLVFYSESIKREEFAQGILWPQGIGRRPMYIPLAICELKLGEKTNTHAFITYANIAQQIRGVFPFCAYYFLLSSNKYRGLRELRYGDNPKVSIEYS